LMLANRARRSSGKEGAGRFEGDNLAGLFNPKR
jgi:hypothetical protein